MRSKFDEVKLIIDDWVDYYMTYIQIAAILHCSTSYPGQLVQDGLKGLRNGSYAPALSEILYGDRNYYKHTSFNSWKRTGCSSPEWELLRKRPEL